VFLEGDLARIINPPTGDGLGGNTGVQDAHKLALKLWQRCSMARLVPRYSIPVSSPLGKVARARNGKKNDVIQYYLTGQKGNAFSPNFKDCNIAVYKNEHLTDIGKVLYAMGYDIDELYVPDFNASKKLLKRREENDNKKKKKGMVLAQGPGGGADE
jgi:hypothetical protein